MALDAQSMVGNINLVIVLIVVVIAIILALIYRMGYFSTRGKRSKGNKTGNKGFNETYTPQPVSKPPTPLVSREVPQSGGRSLLVESKPMEVKPLQLQQSVDIERIEKLIKGLENTLIQVLKQTSADTADMILSKINELRNIIEELSLQCSSQSPPFTQYGYIPSNLIDFKELFKAKYVGLIREGDVLEYVGDPISNELLNTVINTNSDFSMYTVNNDYLYIIKYNDLKLVVELSNYLDPVSVELLRLLYRRFVDEVFRPGSRNM